MAPVADVCPPGPCQLWLTADDLLVCPCPAIERLRDESAAPEDFEAATLTLRTAATELLYWLSGRRYPGLCTGRDALCRDCECNRESCCCRMDRYRLSREDVVEVTAVTLDGAPIDPATYRLDAGRWLTRVRPAGGDPDVTPHWPACTGLDDAEPRMVAEYTWGRLPPASGVMAAAALACDLAAGCAGGECAVSPRTVNLVRQGVTVNMADQSVLTDVMGIPAVDRFLRAVNPKGLRRRATLTSLDVAWPLRLPAPCPAP